MSDALEKPSAQDRKTGKSAKKRSTLFSGPPKSTIGQRLSGCSRQAQITANKSAAMNPYMKIASISYSRATRLDDLKFQSSGLS
jgi:hypothetical protein